MKNYYDTLGVNSNASQDEIKKAFRKLSMKHHPDRGGSEEKFKEINEAYSVLGNVQLRQEYDDPTPEIRFNAGGFSDVRSHIFDEFFRQQRERRTSSIRLNLHVDLKTAINGGSKLVSLQTPQGHFTAEINVPVGVRDGETVRYPRLVEGSDLNITFKINPDPTWERVGYNLTRDYALDFWDLILGTKIVVKSIYDEQFQMTIPPRTEPGTLMRIKGKGVNGQGDMFVRILAKIPDEISDEIIDSIKRLRE